MKREKEQEQIVCRGRHENGLNKGIFKPMYTSDGWGSGGWVGARVLTSNVRGQAICTRDLLFSSFKMNILS